MNCALAWFIQDYHEQDEQEESRVEGGDCFPLARLTALLGEEHTTHFPALLHLVVADSAYSEMNSKFEGVDFSKLC